jgi:hypothetical protein
MSLYINSLDISQPELFVHKIKKIYDTLLSQSYIRKNREIYEINLEGASL